VSNLVILFIHFIATLARLLGPGGVRSIVAESLILKHQLLIVNRSRQRSPNLCTSDRILAGLMALLVRPTRLLRSAIVLKPSTLLGLHKALSKQKYRVLFCPNRRLKPGPKGPRAELFRAVVEMKQRNPNWGCPRIAQQIALAFHIQINKDVVRRILGHHYQPGHSSSGPSWLTFLGHMKDSLWSMDLFRCESATLQTCGWRIVILPIFPWDFPSCYDSAMSNLVILFVHFLATLARLLGPRGVRSIVVESLILKHQLLIVARSRQRSPNLCTSDRILAGLNGTLGTSHSSAPFRNRSEAFDTASPS